MFRLHLDAILAIGGIVLLAMDKDVGAWLVGLAAIVWMLRS